MPRLEVTWHTHPELRRTIPFCDICDSLNEATWTFQTESDPFPPVLSHPVHGVVWDCNADDSRAHGSSRLGCYCTLTWKMIDVDLTTALFKLRARVDTVKRELEAQKG